MMISGLASVSFRKLDCAAVVRLAKDAGLGGIEWIGDAHVPAGDKARAREAAVATADAGLQIAGYGSYFRAGEKRDDLPEFPLVLESAVALGTPVIRSWAGLRPSSEADAAYRSRVVKDLVDAGELAKSAGIKMAVEYHSGTLTDDDASALTLLKELEGSNVYFYWQPPGNNVTSNLVTLRQLSHHIINLHVFHWVRGKEGPDRRPLEEGADEWRQYLSLPELKVVPHFALLEFVRGDNPAQFLADAAILNKLCK